MTISLPDSEVTQTLKAQIGWILINRDGPAIQPGSRSYERSWIRDGALTSAALLRLGHGEVVKEFLEWFAPYQYGDGKVPCCVDRRGSDPVPEHDSHGEFIYLAAEYLRLTDDRPTVAKLWPHVRAAAAYLDTLRAQRRTPEWREKGKERFYGILPPSISHEGYSAKPMHSYWDDLWALRGYKDAVWLAEQLGHREDLKWLKSSRDEFSKDFAASVLAAMKFHKITYIPGCADLGDFDATSTTIALDPVQAQGVLPEGALKTTFDGYWTMFTRRAKPQAEWDAFTPYELRAAGALAILGQQARAAGMMWMMDYRRPIGWRQWAEVVGHQYRHPRFIGDMPHTWVGSDFVRSVLTMLAYERESDSALVLAPGVSQRWQLQDCELQVDGLRTRWGPVRYQLRRETTRDSTGYRERYALRIEKNELRVPPGGVVLSAPQSWRHDRENGEKAPGMKVVCTDDRGRKLKPAADGSVTVRSLPAEVRWEVQITRGK